MIRYMHDILSVVIEIEAKNVEMVRIGRSYILFMVCNIMFKYETLF